MTASNKRKLKKLSLIIMTIFYLSAGINHFRHPEMYIKIMPDWIPYHEFLVALSGVVEIVLALLLIMKKTRTFAAWGIIVLLVAVFPANIQMLINYKIESNPNLWVAIIRLPLQIVLIWWAYGFTKAKELKIKEVSL